MLIDLFHSSHVGKKRVILPVLLCHFLSIFGASFNILMSKMCDIVGSLDDRFGGFGCFRVLVTFFIVKDMHHLS